MAASEKLIYTRFDKDGLRRVEREVIREAPVTIYVNRLEWVTVLCTPRNVNFLTLGFLYLEGLIAGMDDVALMRVCDDERTVDVRLTRQDVSLPQRRVLTSGCGGGVTFADGDVARPVVESSLRVAATELSALMRQMSRQAELYRTTGGVHTSALSDGQRLLVLAEDVGRHNTIDKIAGQCLWQGIPTADRIILTTGRVSSEMLSKVARMGVPVVASRTSPTLWAVELAAQWGITLAGYVRAGGLNVYTGEERIDFGQPYTTTSIKEVVNGDERAGFGVG